MLKPGIMDSIRVWIKVLPYTPQNLLGIRLLLNGSFLDDHDMFFQSNTKQKPLNSNYDDIFGGFQKSTNQSSPSIYNNGVSTFDYDSIFSKSGGRSSSMNLYDDDVFGGMPGLKRSQNSKHDDMFASFASSQTQNDSTDDLLGDFGEGMKSKSSSRNGSKIFETKESTFRSADDPFLVFESASNPAYAASELPAGPLDVFSNFNKHRSTKLDGFSIFSSLLRPPPKPGQVSRPEKVKSSAASSVDDLEEFAMGGSVHDKASRYMEAEDAPKKSQLKGEDDRESILGTSYRSNRVPKSRATTLDPLFDAKIQNKEQKTSTTVSSSAKKVSPAPMKNMVDDLSSIFRAASVYGEFEEGKGESEETHRATLGRHQRTQDRVARAVSDINKHGLQTQHEQEENHRIAEAKDFKTKHWAMGKEGNMHALLSSLQQGCSFMK
ncbi:hypothetical protein SLE2022_183010 [Rubroshorea leprosula]